MPPLLRSVGQRSGHLQASRPSLRNENKNVCAVHSFLSVSDQQMVLADDIDTRRTVHKVSDEQMFLTSCKFDLF